MALDELLVALRAAAEVLEQSASPFDRAWAGHFRSDAHHVLLLRETWREPAPAEVEVR